MKFSELGEDEVLEEEESGLADGAAGAVVMVSPPVCSALHVPDLGFVKVG
jgi:hypothetical protein